MKILQQQYDTGELSLVDVPVSAPGRGEALVRTGASLISAGTEKMVVELGRKSALGKARARPDLVRQVIDKARQEGIAATLEKVRSKLETPIPLGYSAAGVVEEAGGESGVAAGDRVAAGGAGIANHAEYNTVPRNLLTRIPDGVSDEEAAFVTVGAIALQGVRRTAPTVGERVGVIGLGLIGQLTAQILAAAGCDVIGSDVDPWKLEIAERLGIHRAVPAGEFVPAATAFSGGVGLDAVIIAASTESDAPVHDAGVASRQGGRVVSVGVTPLNVPRDLYYYRELDLRLSHAYGPGRHDPAYEEQGRDYPIAHVRWTEGRNFAAFLSLVERRTVRPAGLITHRIPFSDATGAYELMKAGSEPFLGIVLTYGTDPAAARVTTVAVPAVHPAPSRPVADGRISVGVLGAGAFASSVLLPRLARRDDLRREVVASRRGMSARHAARRYRFAEAATDYGTVLSREDLDAVVIATRHGSHAPLVAEALSAGRHVFVEKPLAITPEGLETVEAAADGSGILQVGFNRRFSSHARELREAVGGREAILSYRVNAGEIPADHWIHDSETGGGRIIGEVCHFVDLASFVLDAVPAEVQAVRAGAGETHDDVVLTLRYENGSVATILYSAKGNRRLAKEYIEVFCGDTAAVCDNFRTTTVYRGTRRRRRRTRGQDKGFDAELEAFFESLRSGRPAIPFESLAATTRATFAAVASLSTGTVQRL